MGLEESIASNSVNLLIGATVVLAVLVGISLQEKYLNEKLKKFLFLAIVVVIAVPTLYMIISTVYLNTISVSKGPVHWHADVEVWACGQEVALQDPTGFLSNKIGTATLHEHNDKRIHLEGVVVHPEDASLGRFFQVIGGELINDSLIVPTNNGPIPYTNGSMCNNGSEGQVQVFVYQTGEDQYFSQKKLENPNQYLISPYSAVPQGDCVIVEFDQPKDRTDKLCRSYKVAMEIDKLKGERP
ncbi:MAG: hypothetical protein H0W89_07790 [Candidatus Levybacteria bacterium]|nr:hypothetical protein [Candidatus Levybacteria bacterium]